MPTITKERQAALNQVFRLIDSYCSTWVDELFPDQQVVDYSTKIYLRKHEVERLQVEMRRMYGKRLVIGIRLDRVQRRTCDEVKDTVLRISARHRGLGTSSARP